MNKEYANCIDCGTEFCPCKLAETGECILCSQLQGEHFCDCLNWNGVCIYQELYNNGMKAKKGRSTYSCKIKYLRKDKKIILIKIEVPHKLALDLVKPGGYVFIRTDENQFFDIPISVMDSDISSNILSLVIEIRGIKTKKLLDIKENDILKIRAPYWNGVFGQKNIERQKNNNVLVLGRGIGMAPMVPVIRKIKNNNNNVDVYIDRGNFKDNFSKEYIRKYNCVEKETNLLNKGLLSEEGKFIIKNSIADKNIKLIHIAGADVLTYRVIEYLDELNRKDILLSCCNNFKMCCGEGICGACTARYAGHKVKRFCKLQTEPRNIFEGRRLI